MSKGQHNYDYSAMVDISFTRNSPDKHSISQIQGTFRANNHLSAANKLNRIASDEMEGKLIGFKLTEILNGGQLADDPAMIWHAANGYGDYYDKKDKAGTKSRTTSSTTKKTSTTLQCFLDEMPWAEEISIAGTFGTLKLT